jgi:hypothetical protein
MLRTLRTAMVALLSLPVLAAGEAPPAEFWHYLIQYSDQDGELFDPLDLADTEQAMKMKPSRTDSADNIQPDKPEEESRK